MDFMERRKRRLFLAGTAALLTAMILLSWFFPDTGDDWFREGLGAEIHSPGALIREVAFRWRSSNSRILGNILAYSAGSRPILKALLRGGILTALAVLTARSAGARGIGGLALAAAGLLALPREMFAQVYPWAAGFFNYVPPVAMFLAAFLILQGSLWGEEVSSSPPRMAAAFLMGLGGALFVEHHSLYAILAGAALLLLELKQWRRCSSGAGLFLLGAVLGAALLFASPAYRQIDAAGGAYNSGLADGLPGLLEMAGENWKELTDDLLVHCPMLLAILTGAVVRCFLRRSPGGLTDRILIALLLLLALVLLANAWFPFENAMRMRYLALLHLVLTAAAALRWSESPRGFLFFWGSAIAVTLPLLVVNPIGPRCLYEGYVFLLIAAGQLLSGTELSRRELRLVVVVPLLAVLSVYIRFLGLLLPVHQADVARREEVRRSMEEGERTVVLQRLPHGDWFWEPDSEKMVWAFYYETPGDLTITFQD